MEPIDLSVEESNDFFRVANAIKQIEESQDKDIEKIKILYRESKQLFQYLNIKDGKSTVKGLKWDGQTYITKDMTEEEVVKEVIGSEDRMHLKESKRNLIYLAHHYKKMWKNSKIYIPFFDYCMDLMERIVNHPRIGVIFDDSKRADELQEVIADVEQENLKLTTVIVNLDNSLYKLLFFGCYLYMRIRK